MESVIARERLHQAKWAYTTRRVIEDQDFSLLSGDICPHPGDLLLAEVVELGQHKRLELVTSRRATLFEGDEIVIAYGNRYAPDQFEGVVPANLGNCRLVAAGGVAARLLNRHERMKTATRIKPLGLLADNSGQRINLNQYRLPRCEQLVKKPLVLVVAGTSMNSGKTTTCANLVKGFVRRRVKVAAAKFTGTGAGADYRTLVDAGADPVFDFLDAGYVSTYRIDKSSLLDIVMTLGCEMIASNPDVIVIEVADGLLQRETALLFATNEFTDWIDGVLFAANDALGAQAGVAWLSARQLPVIGITGVLTSAPLGRREAEEVTGLPVFTTSSLARTSVSALLHDCLGSRRRDDLDLQQVAKAG